MYRLKKVNISMGDYVGIIVICVYAVPIVEPLLRLLAFRFQSVSYVSVYPQSCLKLSNFAKLSARRNGTRSTNL